MMNKKILMPTDFSDNSLKAIEYALNLYEKVPCTFYLLHMYTVDPFSMQSSAYIIPERGQGTHDVAKEKARAKFDGFLERVKAMSKNPDHVFKTKIVYKKLLEAVRDAVAKYDIGMVVMGTKGKTGSETVIFGTNALMIMEGITECPVMAIPHTAEIKVPKEIVFPTDLLGPFKSRELRYLVRVAELHRANICILHIKKSDKYNQKQLEGRELLESILGNVDHSFHELKGIKVQAGINAFIESRNSDMVAFINQKTHFFSNLFRKPLVQQLSYHSNVPVLVLKDRN
ncbi:universal stress protein [Maribacter sp. 2307ULW6-5]|uniref:universal stress protein n=1 Tax=Maribacter sp. 2307ULW6-5 TaxID=3386275 RepID=UPI0039BD5C80